MAPRRLTGAACSIAKLMALALERKGRGPWAMAVARSLPRNSSPGRLRIAVFMVLFFFVLGLAADCQVNPRHGPTKRLFKRRLEQAHVKRMKSRAPMRERMCAANVAGDET